MMIHSRSIKWFTSVFCGLALLGCQDEEREEYSNAHPYNTDSLYYSELDSCPKAAITSKSCSTNILPVIGQETMSPSINDIMDRIVVSHDWMGERFARVLRTLPTEMLPLFRGVTAIVIDDDVRPSYYTTLTGAIYLDPATLWLTQEEKETINPKEDYRTGFSDPLNFRRLFRYTHESKNIYRNYGSLKDDSTRRFDDILMPIASLLLHELAHANDFFPPEIYDLVEPDYSIFAALREFREEQISYRLDHSQPLESVTMFELADVMYNGAEPTVDHLEITGLEVGATFEPDGAADAYAYTSNFEDTAMLFETAMMKYFFDAEADTAFTSAPLEPGQCDSYLIEWGVRNRVGDSAVLPRAKFVSQELLPEIDTDDFFENFPLPSEIPSRAGSWCLPQSGDALQSKTSQGESEIPTLLQEQDLVRPYL